MPIMRIHDMFQKDIDRDINGVIKVAEKSDAVIEQELSEYVVTHELASHFDAFFSSYERALERPTDKIGVWISGFFGSGKSHFLTMLSHLLSNREVAGHHALDYFADKFPTPELYERARRCASPKTETILFNIDSKNVGGQDGDALKRTFARVFYDHLDFYGEDLKLARLERFIDGQGKTEEFRARYQELTGEGWKADRKNYDFNADEVIGALVDTGVMSEAEAERYLDSDDQVDFSIDALTTEIADYARRRAAEEGGQFRLLFMVDEVGQYVNNGRDVSRMLNLQTIVEELGSKAQGLVWVVVTSQEAIDEVVKMAGTSVDFSKIQGRFTTRLSLSGINADEVIKRRILEKNEAAADLLRMEYGQRAAALKNLFHFKNAVEDLGGYEDADDYVATYPFVNYQFKLMQKSLDELRKHGSSGKSTSGNERSMLSGFQEAAQAVEDGDETTLVPFWRFYDTVQAFLEGHVRRVINRADEAARTERGLAPFDVQVLKLLFLIRWVNDVESNPENIAILMVDRTDANLLDLRRAVNESLERLVRQNYAGRSGETYQFLTDDEQEIARAISNTAVSPAEVTTRIGQLVYGQIFDTNKLHYGENDFDVEKYVDETRVGAPGGMVLRVMTAAADEYATAREALLARSQRNEAICLLSDDARYYELIQDALRVEIYANTNNTANQPENVRRIIRDRRNDAAASLREARELLEEGIRRGEFYASGYEVKPQGSTAKQMLSSLLGNLVTSIYPKLECIDKNYHTDVEILEILRGQRQAIDSQRPNERAIAAMRRYLENQHTLNADTPMSEVQRRFQEPPFGWRGSGRGGAPRRGRRTPALCRRHRRHHRILCRGTPAQGNRDQADARYAARQGVRPRPSRGARHRHAGDRRAEPPARGDGPRQDVPRRALLAPAAARGAAAHRVPDRQHLSRPRGRGERHLSHQVRSCRRHRRLRSASAHRRPSGRPRGCSAGPRGRAQVLPRPAAHLGQGRRAEERHEGRARVPGERSRGSRGARHHSARARHAQPLQADSPALRRHAEGERRARREARCQAARAPRPSRARLRGHRGQGLRKQRHARGDRPQQARPSRRHPQRHVARHARRAQGAPLQRPDHLLRTD